MPTPAPEDLTLAQSFAYLKTRDTQPFPQLSTCNIDPHLSSAHGSLNAGSLGTYGSLWPRSWHITVFWYLIHLGQMTALDGVYVRVPPEGPGTFLLPVKLPIPSQSPLAMEPQYCRGGRGSNMLDQHAECFYVPSLPRCSLCVGTGFLGGHLCIAEFFCVFPENLKWLSQAGMGHVVSACPLKWSVRPIQGLNN